MNSCFQVHNIKISLKLHSPSPTYFTEIIRKIRKSSKKILVTFMLYILTLHIFSSKHQKIFYIAMLQKLKSMVKYFHRKEN